jgi:Membrane bound O-acyl transferase family
MWVIVAALFVFMKFVVLAAAGTGLSLPRAIAFFFWPGMRPAPFAAPRREVGGVRERLLRGTRNLAGGVVLFLIARRLPLVPALILALPAFSLILHFGICPLVAAGWRAAGFDVDDIFREPWRSRSLAEFWSRRWNVGFSEMLSVTVSRPLAPRLGRPASIVAAFLASGVLHELAISVPAGGGYGLPTLYFALHGALVAAGTRGRIVTLLAVILPLPLLFHAPFLRAIVLPLLQ